MTRSLLLVSLAAGALAVPIPASSAATELAIREISIRPASPVVGAGNTVRLVIDVVAKGAKGKDGVTIKVEPGATPGATGQTPITGGSPVGPLPPATGAMRVTAPGGKPIRGVKPAPGGETVVDPAQAADPGARPAGEGWPSWFGPDIWASARRPQPRPITVEPALPFMPAWRTVPVGTRMLDGWQTWRFLPDKVLTRFYPSGTWTITATATGDDGQSVTRNQTFQLRRETKLSSVRAEKAGGAGSVRLRGSLTRVDPRGYEDYAPFADQQVEILWRAEAEDTWERVAIATTGETGDFGRTVRGRPGGYWRARYLGTDHYAPKVSKIQESGINT
ncbi:hypothetical protein [Nonomuraea aurantiaca]|jgi:hypothetical protein|uniref:hypothetical protein n=1 Tax=Nonomuraea aurantiaca TaxID=2878562 RepID=UPI001CDA5283|nr:hypothetical protein [Nonomuraea aurantiaca]MCA2222230.1 hypothetical protein [Nonomuraea aurantiaca]